MAIVPQASALKADSSAITLPLYAQIIEYPESAFFGLREDDAPGWQIKPMWLKPERDTLAYYLAEAQADIEDQLGYFISPRYITGTIDAADPKLERYVDEQNYRRSTVMARWPKIIGAGVKGSTEIDAGDITGPVYTTAATTTLTVTTTVTDADELKVFHPDTDVEIHPSAISISGGVAIITIPKARMVKGSLAANPSTGLDYDDNTNYIESVRVFRIYLDDTTQAVLTENLPTDDITPDTQTAYMRVISAATGQLRVSPALCENGSWRLTNCCLRRPRRAQLNYLCGEKELSRTAREAILRLAHSKMPEEPCGDNQVSQRLWMRDRNVPDLLTAERLNCPFGLSDGAWVAWQFVRSLRTVRMMVI